MVYSGGPCGEFLTALHGNQALSNIEVAPGLHYSQEPAKLVQVVEQQVDPVRFFVGFAGWDTGQLEAELEDGSWLSMPASPEHVFASDDDLWPKLVKQVHRRKNVVGVEDQTPARRSLRQLIRRGNLTQS